MIRRAKARDLEGLLALYDQLRPELVWTRRGATKPREAHRRALARIIRDPRQHVLVAGPPGKVQGALSLYLLPRVWGEGRPWALLDAVVVAPEARGRGLGRRLIAQALKLARLHGCAEADLAALPRFRRARRFYEDLGFEQASIGMKMKL